MKRLFLTSEVQYVAHSIATKLSDEVKKPAVFITTAIRDKPHSDLAWHYANKASMEKAGFIFDEYNIAGKTEEQINSDLSKYQIMYVEGGNSYYLLQESQKNNFGSFVKAKVEEGMIYIGTSAGSIIMGPDIEPVRRDETTPLAPDLKGTKAFNIVNFTIMPHWGSPDRLYFYNKYRIPHIYHEDFPYILLTDNQYIEVQDDWYKIVDVTKE
jgi:dipeptidase E